MQIKDAVSLRDATAQKKRTNASNGPSSLLNLFSVHINQQESEVTSYEEDILELRREIEKAGDKLVQEPTLTSFKNFRDVLSRLAKRISNEAYRLDKFGGTPQNPRYFEIITIINGEADRLYNLIVQQQKDNMAITAKVIGIKGLVVDLIT